MRNLLFTLAVLLSCAVTSAYAQSLVHLTGTITDEKGAPLQGVAVYEKGSKGGTHTQADGSFTLSAKPGSTVLISSLGYELKEVKVAASTSKINVSLNPDTKSLSEIVVTGVGVATSKKKLAIAVESITSDKLPAAPTASIDQALVGKIAGAQISSTNGTPGANINILLRGINSIQGGTYPMILMDGIELHATNLNSIDLSSIERVEVIQGAAAATIYGAQGANGVIQLFTKKGKGGRINIDISSSYASNTYINKGKVHKATMHGFETDDNGNVIDGDGNPVAFDSTLGTYPTNVIWNSTDPTNKNDKPYNKNLRYYDHYKMFFKSAPTVNNSITISGSKEKVDFLFTGSNNYQLSNVKNNGDYSRSNFTSNVGVELLKNLKFRTITQLVYTRNTIRSDQGVLYALNNSRPFANYDQKDKDGNYDYYFGDAVGVNGYNPNYLDQYYHYKDNKIDVVQNFNLNYKFPRFVELDAKYGLNYRTEESINNYYNQSKNANSNYYNSWVGSFNSSDNTGELSNYNYKTTFQNFVGNLTFHTDFDKDFGLRIPLRTTTQLAFDYRKNVYKQYITYGIQLPDYTPYTAAQAATYGISSDYTEPFVTYGYLFNQRFEFGDIGGISGGFRSDYSSAFGAGHKPFTFPRGDAYLRLSALNFWQNGGIGKVLQEFKIRAAYGQAGIQPTPFQRFVTLNTQSLGSKNVFYTPADQPNPNLNVEVSKEFEIGTDITIKVLRDEWLRSVNISGTYWKRKTNNAIYKVDQAPSSGLGTLVDNAFGLGSNGVQASLNATVYSGRTFSWNFTANFSHQSSKITSVIGPPVVVTSGAGSTGLVLIQGQKIGQIYGYLGVHSVDAKDASGNYFIPKDQQANYTVAGNGWVVDKTSKFPFYTSDLYPLGDPNPKFNMAFINEFSFRDYLSFSFQWDWLHGNHLYNQTKEWMYRDGINGDYDVPVNINGETAPWTAFYRGEYAAVSRDGTKNYFYEDASFWRLRNVMVAFDFARAFKIKAIRKLQLVLSGRNLVTFTKYTGFDPEISSGSTNSAFDRGVDHNTMPNYKTYQVGLNVGL